MKRVIILSFCLFILTFQKSFCQARTSSAAVGQRTFSFDDKSRNRKLITEVWYPTNATPTADDQSPFVRMSTARDGQISKGTFPLILFSHGTGGGRLTLEWFCAGLASQGFIVAAVHHFGNTFDNPIPVEFAKIWERPQDIRFVLDQLLQSEIAGSINPNRIGMAGFSLGGYTSFAVAGATMNFEALSTFVNSEQGKEEADIPEMPGLAAMFQQREIQESFKKAPSLQDTRIKSVFVMSPALGQAFPAKEDFKKVNIPVFIVAADNDQMCPLKTNAAYYAKMIPEAQYKVIGNGAGHYVFLNEAKEGLKNEAPMFFKDPEGVDRASIHHQTLDFAVGHFTKTLKK
jgi:predicted dienelactone hydrolase